MAHEAQNIGGRIKELREERGLTQREFAALLPGKTEGKDISRWENGKHRPSPDTLSAIAEALGTSVADLHAGPMAARPERGETPDPFGATRRRDAGSDAVDRIEAAIRELLGGQAELSARLSKVERLLEDQRKQQQPASQRHKAAKK